MAHGVAEIECGAAGHVCGVSWGDDFIEGDVTDAADAGFTGVHR